MPHIQFGPDDALYYAHVAPASKEGLTYVFFNALTGDTGSWETVIAPRLQAEGHGTLAFNYRGQTDSPFSDDLQLSADQVVSDALTLLSFTKPARPVLVGLSIGGLFAARAWQQGAETVGMVLVNTLRKDGPRLKWIGDALVRAVEVGGLDLFRDLFMPLLVNENWLAQNRSAFLKPDPRYPPLSPRDGTYKLLSEAGRTADWDFPWENLDLPTLVITGLQDHVFLEPETVSALYAKLPRGRWAEMPDAGHLIPAECPEALADMLIDFAKEL
jgi:3-oxoadipate enol-lactonase